MNKEELKAVVSAVLLGAFLASLGPSVVALEFSKYCAISSGMYSDCSSRVIVFLVETYNAPFYVLFVGVFVLLFRKEMKWKNKWITILLNFFAIIVLGCFVLFYTVDAMSSLHGLRTITA